eukprot:13674507-Alexandrium_andersonii.AAC.1
MEGALLDAAIVAQEARVLGQVQVSLSPQTSEGGPAQLGISRSEAPEPLASEQGDGGAPAGGRE